MREISFYKKESGSCPIEEFLDDLAPKQAQKVAWVMGLIEELEIIPSIYFKKLVNTKNIWEIRVQINSNIFRVLGFFLAENRFSTTHGFQKKTNKVPKKEIILAEKYKLDYLRRL